MEKSVQGFISSLILLTAPVWFSIILTIFAMISLNAFFVALIALTLFLLALLVVSTIKCIQGLRKKESKKSLAIAGLVINGIIIFLGIPVMILVVAAVLGGIPAF